MSTFAHNAEPAPAPTNAPNGARECERRRRQIARGRDRECDDQPFTAYADKRAGAALRPANGAVPA